MRRWHARGQVPGWKDFWNTWLHNGKAILIYDRGREALSLQPGQTMGTYRQGICNLRSWWKTENCPNLTALFLCGVMDVGPHGADTRVSILAFHLSHPPRFSSMFSGMYMIDASVLCDWYHLMGYYRHFGIPSSIQFLSNNFSLWSLKHSSVYIPDGKSSTVQKNHCHW